METIISFFKRRWWSFAPLVLFACVFVLPKILLEYRESSLIFDISDLALYCIPGSLFLLFVRKQVILWWFPVSVLFLVVAFYKILQANPGGGWWGTGERAYLSLFFGLSLSVITILWSIIHTLILRHKDKNAPQTTAK